jgi:hypothetical protein
MPVFPLPPPPASASTVLPDELFGNAPFETLHDIDVALQAGLRQTGYIDTSYLRVAGGFAIATQLERIKQDGAPGQPRFSLSTKIHVTTFSLTDYLRALFTANPDHYRIIVFVVTDVPFEQTDQQPTPDEVKGWLRGPRWLPPETSSIRWTPKVKCTALVYEFVREQEQSARVLHSYEGALDARTHLEGAGLWNPQVFTTIRHTP